MKRKTVTRQLPAALVALVLVAGLGLAGCGSLRIHRPQDLARAQEAQTQFQAAGLAQTAAGERERLAQVLAQELEVVRRHTLARRDARLVYVIAQGDTLKAWAFLEEDIDKRLKELGIDGTDELKDWLRVSAQAEQQKKNLDDAAASYGVELKSDSALPSLACPPNEAVQPPRDDKIEARLFWDEYAQGCKLYLELRGGRAAGNPEGNGLPLDKPLANGPAIQAMSQARDAATAATQAAADKLEEAQKAYAKALKTDGASADRGSVRAAAIAAIARAQEVRDAVEDFTQGDDVTALNKLGLSDLATKLGKAKSELSSAKINLSAVVGDLGAVPELTRLKAGRNELVAGLSSTLQGKTASDVFSSLKAIGVALEGPKEAPLTAMVLKERQLDLDVVAAQDREAFYDQTLALLEEQETAYRDELAFLGQAELRRQELVDEGCLSSVTDVDSDYIKGLFSKDPKMVKCKGLVYHLLVQYSAAWSLGRVKSEQIDYRLIALHHTSALDTSEVAFQKWASLLGPPIDQLVAFSKTGLRPEDIVTPIVNVFGLGAIAAGVN